MRLLFILIFLFSINLTAQDHPIGIKIGGNSSTLSGDGTENISSNINFHAGLFTEIKLTEDFRIQPELLFSVYGFEEDFEGISNIRLNYVILPVMVKYFISNAFSFDAGPQVGLLVTAKNGTGSQADVKPNFYDRDFGANIGASYILSEKVSASIRYYFGLSDITTETSNNQNRALQLAFQFKIN
ncbi:porin family protein [uncultured Winogradskyella sp.]|uniref:porin family protein n=1 Tax=uncultured Winogradskyella sp. TaxID=395353 RepID=UPI002611F588|nr:porin family protein [uncultured Winogradskyella sp.]